MVKIAKNVNIEKITKSNTTNVKQRLRTDTTIFIL